MKKKKFWTKVMVWIMAALMIGSCMIVLFQACSIGALEPDAEDIETVEAESPEYVTVGLMYGSDVTVGFETYSTVGFNVHAVTATKTERSYEDIYTIELPKISVVCDDNLSQTAYTYSIYDTSKKCIIGGYHLETVEDIETREEAEVMLELVKEWLDEEGSDMHPFIAHIDGVYKIRIGDYSSVENVEKKLGSIPDMAEAIELDIAEPSDTALMIVDPETNVIYFEFDGGGETRLGLSAMDVDGEKQYLKTPAKRLYDGFFLFERNRDKSVDGVALTNMLTLEDYITGVLPYEISPTWPFEALRAFAISVRGYTLQSKNRHYTSYGFDICNTTHCQVYRGISNANAAVYEAVESTKGLVLSDGETVVTTYYSSSTGGYTASAKDTWGGDDSPHLVSTYTPWERYSEHSKGVWTSEVSGKELADYLRNRGYDKISGESIVDIEINEYSGDSPYVYSITYTDSKGNELTIERCDKVRTSISKYVNSANFVVGKGSVTYEYDKVIKIDPNGTNSFTTGNYSPIEEEVPKVLTASGIKEIDKKRVYVQNASDVNRFELATLNVATLNSGYYYSFTDAPGVVLRRYIETVVASDENSFVFAGKGWGHGVGLSQYGILDLAEAGATAEQILSYYFPALSLLDYKEVGKEISNSGEEI
ncbi:MAG: SpoIID/LytB domain-containing protein [Clostridia bacterium]|nr:SpoIID/LytB domain-containing protein [Clostridia bacterium]